jgi:hypothetical protein
MPASRKHEIKGLKLIRIKQFLYYGKIVVLDVMELHSGKVSLVLSVDPFDLCHGMDGHDIVLHGQGYDQVKVLVDRDIIGNGQHHSAPGNVVAERIKGKLRRPLAYGIFSQVCVLDGKDKRKPFILPSVRLRI